VSLSSVIISSFNTLVLPLPFIDWGQYLSITFMMVSTTEVVEISVVLDAGEIVVAGLSRFMGIARNSDGRRYGLRLL